MKKLLAAALALMLTLSACHGTLAPRGSANVTQDVTLPEALDTSRNLQITFWAKNDTNKTQTDIYKRAIQEFQAIYPNITVNLRLYTDYNRIYNDVITNIATKTTPNVCITYPDHIATYLTGADVVVPLDSLFDDPNYGLGGQKLGFAGPARSELVGSFLDECSIGGVHYAVPFMRSTEALYVNKTYVERLGFSLPETVTWDFVWQVSQAATQKDANGNYKVNGQKVMIPFIYKSTDNMMIQLLRQKGAGYSKSNGEIQIFNDTTKDILYTVAENVKNGAFSTFKISSYPANFLNAGQCIFAVDSTAGATWMGCDAPLLDISEDALVEFETAVLPIPQVDTAHPQMISQGPSICLFQKDDPQEVLASWLFAQFLLTDEIQLAYAGTEGYVPVTTRAQTSAQYRDYLARSGEDNSAHYAVKIQASQLLLENTENTFVTPVFNGSASLRNAAGQMIEDVAKSIRRKQTVDDAYMDKLFAETTALYRLDQIQVSEDTAADLGPLPATARLLLGAIGLCWLCMAAYVLLQARKRKTGN